jgi:hypothetical protein
LKISKDNQTYENRGGRPFFLPLTNFHILLLNLAAGTFVLEAQRYVHLPILEIKFSWSKVSAHFQAHLKFEKI